MKIKTLLTGIILSFIISTAAAENGYRLWLRYDPVNNKQLLTNYKTAFQHIHIAGNGATTDAIKNELQNGLAGLLNQQPVFTTAANATLLIGTPAASAAIKNLNLPQLRETGNEGYVIITKTINGKKTTIIAGNTDVALMYGSFHLLRLLQTNQPIINLSIVSSPKIDIRILNHWDNLNRTVERGYAGSSLWNWHNLPGVIEPRYIDYARANASVGINGTVLNNVNANASILTKEYLVKVAALANVFRTYGIKVYLTARFSAPVEIGGLKTADPNDVLVQRWWVEKTNEIYALIPDFGGFVVKANSEGQPGPQNYGRNHADGANMLADALEKHKGVVMWRAFVYSSDTPEDRFKQAYNEFKPLDGTFRKNVILQVKNGPIDFQPREPFHPLFGAMPKSNLMPEFQLTQEYLGFATNLVYLAPLFKECLDADTYAHGRGSTVAKMIDGTYNNQTITAMAGVANIGSDINWTGHPFGQSNWYAFGRLAWDHDLSSQQIAGEWTRMTFTNQQNIVRTITSIMDGSREAAVNYMTPLGLHHIMGYGHHYGPAPWYDKAPRADWNPVYFHKADSIGVGFDRTAKGTNALAQYQPEVQKQFENINTCPEQFLLWFHHVPWTFKMQDGKTLWNELCTKYYAGADSVQQMINNWETVKGSIDNERFNHITSLLKVQQEEAIWWRNACVLYFQTFSGMPIPQGFPKPNHTLDYYEALHFEHAPGNG